MSQSSFHPWLRRVSRTPLRFVVAAVLIFAALAIIGLRQNNLQMLKLKEAVYTADKNNGDVQGALTKLQRYVTAHMNTNLSTGSTTVYPPIQLKYTYERLKAAQGVPKTSDEIYTDAQAYCEQQNSTDVSGRNRVPCITQYVQSHGATSAPSTATIPASLYQFSFISPRWSPDLAGWSLVLAGLSLLVAVTLGLLRLWLRQSRS